ncbi:DUF624 domain-containing protein [Deinococcus cellulosilyticus]|uniref:DUF624 domain-containing protein n=1 Tax=Deinococcus cellulosilyticus (strain DSM 18568 / NBRC 106333 / KACC 11606 / 5516J-15) TaxID=1223518 RepID=A0A511N312_DEIC1|nr:DUF624 domain-containing protein [Deinococcus cellulosilyticus]GEM47245.1 hypothetical protein DC3_28800 [Deinococcus cellulosilyticus NBRC 106333 = KACC 11606]
MLSFWRGIREGGVLAWQNLLQLVLLNLILLLLGWTVVLLGPALLAVYEYIARTFRDEEKHRLEELPAWVRSHLLNGVLYLLGWILLLGLLYTNLVFWAQVLPAFGQAILMVLVGYILVFALALQPYLLERLTVHRLPYLKALPAALQDLIREPIASHFHTLVPITLLLISLKWMTLPLIVFTSVGLMFAAARVKAAHQMPEPQEEHLNDNEDPSHAGL